MWKKKRLCLSVFRGSLCCTILGTTQDRKNFLAPFPCCGKNYVEVFSILSEYSAWRQEYHEPWLQRSLEQWYQITRRFPVAHSKQLVCSLLSRNLAFCSKFPETQIVSMKHWSISKFMLSDEIYLNKKGLVIDSHSSLLGGGNGP